MERSEILEVLKKYKERKSGIYGINRIGIFGSCAKGTTKDKSDIDVVIEINHLDIFALVHIKEELEEIFKTKVDIVRNRQKMNPYLKKHIEKEAIYV